MSCISHESLNTGDLVLVAAGGSAFSGAIAASSQGDNKAYDHIGLIEQTSLGPVVWNANVTLGVARETLSEFISRECAKEDKGFHIYRAIDVADYEPILGKLQQWLGLPYNFSYVPSKTAFYCADLIAKAFPTGYFVPKPMKFVGEFWERYFDKQGIPIPHGELGFHPTDMVNDTKVLFRGSLVWRT